MIVKFKKLYEESSLPSFGNGDNHNAGIDLYAFTNNPVIIPPHESRVISTGVAWEPDGATHKCAMIVQSRSGMAFKNRVEASNAGVIDQGYRGEIMVLLYNNGDSPALIESGDRIAQGIVMYLPDISMIAEVTELNMTNRGTNGFGSSGR
jgi:dUTP pyrophosphatase